MIKRVESDYNRICEYCKKSYVNKRSADGNRYCSRKCANHVNLHIAKALTDKVIIGRHSSVYFRKCDICSSSYAARHHKQITCLNSECRRLKRNMLSAIYSFKLSSSKKVVKDITCVECGKEFKNNYGDKRSVYCSIKCSRKKFRRINEAKKRNLIRCVTVENVDPLKVFARDNWKCCLCGVSTPKKKRGSYDDNAPEMDHIISLAEGGEHSYKNVQCCCRKCNQNKGATTKGQFRLFG